MDDATIRILAITLIILFIWWKIRGRKQREEAEATERDWDYRQEDDYHDYEIVARIKSKTTSRTYQVLKEVDVNMVSCTCQGFRYNPETGCVHARSYIETHDTDEDGNPLELGSAPMAEDTWKGRNIAQEMQDTVTECKTWKDLNYVVIDTETTGLTNRSKIVEIAVLNRNGEILMNTLVNPGSSPMRKEATDIHGITRNDVKDKQTFQEIWPDLKAILEQHDIILSYNAGFDTRLMQQSLASEDDAMTVANKPAGCIMEAYTAWRSLEEKKKRPMAHKSLSKAAEEMGIKDITRTHRALDDSQTARILLEAMLAEVAKRG